MIKIILIAALSIVITGCSTHQNVVRTTDVVQPVPGEAKIAIERSNDKLYMGVKARVSINGEEAVALWREEKYARILSPGRITISTDCWSTSGQFTIAFEAEPDRIYEFVVSPNDGHYKETIKGMFWPAMLAGPIGVAIQQATYEIKENQGPFLIKPKEK